MEKENKNLNSEAMAKVKGDYTEKILKPLNGYIGLLLFLVIAAGSTAMIVLGHMHSLVAVYVIGYLLIPVCIVMAGGFAVVSPNEALVLVLFGKYSGTIKQEGFYLYNPLCKKFNPAAVPNMATYPSRR